MNERILYNTIQGDFFSRKALLSAARQVDPSFKETQLRFYIGKLKNEKLIFSVGHNLYSKFPAEKESYRPVNSETTEKIISLMKEEFPLVSFRVWDLSLMNEFLNHLLAHNHVFLEVERDGMEFIYERVREFLGQKVLLNPMRKELELYSEADDVIIQPLRSESPCGTANPYEASLEKIIVDMFANKALQCFISRGDYPQAIDEMFRKYSVSQSKLFRYARRRNKAESIYDFLQNKTDVKLMVEANV